MKSESYIDDILKPYSPFLTPSDLVKIGMFKTPQAAYKARKAGKGPEWLYIPGRGFAYPKEAIAEFLKEKLRTKEIDPIKRIPTSDIAKNARYAS